jgi:hypothetical protein
MDYFLLPALSIGNMHKRLKKNVSEHKIRTAAISFGCRRS